MPPTGERCGRSPPRFSTSSHSRRRGCSGRGAGCLHGLKAQDLFSKEALRGAELLHPAAKPLGAAVVTSTCEALRG